MRLRHYKGEKIANLIDNVLKYIQDQIPIGFGGYLEYEMFKKQPKISIQ